MEKFSQLVTWVDGKVWGWGMILLLLGTHLFMTIRTGFIQRKTITKGIKLSVSKEPDADGEVSQFGALATALASTILGWAYYGERCVEYFAGKKGLIPYRVLYIAVAVIAPIVAPDVVWDIADILNALMAIPNLIAVLLLSPVIVKETKKYLDNLDAKDDTEIPVIKK